MHQILAQAGSEMCLGNGHPDTGGEPLAQWPGGHLDTQLLVDLGMPRSVALPLPEVLQVVHAERESAEMQH